MITVIDPIVPEVGKKYYATICGFTRPNDSSALITAKVTAVGVQTITISFESDGKLLTRGYLQGDVNLIEEVASQPEKA